MKLANAQFASFFIRKSHSQKAVASFFGKVNDPFVIDRPQFGKRDRTDQAFAHHE